MKNKCAYVGCKNETPTKWCPRCRKALALAKKGHVREALALYPEKEAVHA